MEVASTGADRAAAHARAAPASDAGQSIEPAWAGSF
jgi:hypothetical protein